MLSPFPGMDPYLEDPGSWPDLHHRLISAASDQLNAQLRPRYLARIEERVYVDDGEGRGPDGSSPTSGSAIRDRGGSREAIQAGAEGLDAIDGPVDPSTHSPRPRGRRAPHPTSSTARADRS